MHFFIVYFWKKQKNVYVYVACECEYSDFLMQLNIG